MPEEPVVILCGGKGTRLREETEFKPKALVEIGGVPVICHIMAHYAKYGYTNFILALGYMGDKIKEYFMSYREMSGDFTLDLNTKFIQYHSDAPKWKITFVDTGSEAPTGGRIKAVENYIHTPYFLATYCDGLSNVNIEALVRLHKSRNKIATLTSVNPASPFGVLEITDNKIISFKEKPKLDGNINGGFFVFSKDIFEMLDGSSVLEEEVLKNLVDTDEAIAYLHPGFWECMDTFKQVESLNRSYNESIAEGVEAPWQA